MHNNRCFCGDDDKLAKVNRGRFLFAVVALGLLVSCTSSEGDLGRVKRDETLDALLKVGGEVRAKLSGELYSDFNATDEEKQMRDQAWALIRPPHAQDWVSQDLWNFFPSLRYVTLNALTDAQRTRLTPVIDTAFVEKHYYKALRSSRYASHHVRYDRVIDDIQQDRAAFAAFIPVAERVVEMDGERMAALNRLADMDPRVLKDAYARVDENRRFIGWVWRALQFRMRAYAYAIKRLEVETPSPKVADANAALKLLYVDFQAQNGTLAAEPTDVEKNVVRRSRYTRRQWAQEDPNMVK